MEKYTMPFSWHEILISIFTIHLWLPLFFHFQKPFNFFAIFSLLNLLVTSAKIGLGHDIPSHLNSQTKHLNFGPRINDLTRKQCQKYFYNITFVVSAQFVMVLKWWIFQKIVAFKKQFFCEGKQIIFLKYSIIVLFLKWKFQINYLTNMCWSYPCIVVYINQFRKDAKRFSITFIH